MRKTIVKVVAFTILAVTLAGYGRSNSVSMESTAVPEKTRTEGAASKTAETKEEGAGAISCKLAFPPNTQNNAFQTTVSDTFRRLCDERGYDHVCFDLNYDLNTQLSQMTDVATQNFDTVFVIPVDSAGVRQSLRQIHEKNTPILSIDTPVIDDSLNSVETVIAAGAYNAGTLVGQQMVTDYPDRAKITILDFPSNEPCIDRVADFLDGLGDVRDKFDIVAQQDGAMTLDIFMPIAEDAIQTSPDLSAFFYINDPSVLGAVAAIKASGRTGVGVYSIDASPDDKAIILDGSFTAVTAQALIGITETAFERVEELLTDGEIEREILLPSFLIGKGKAEAALKD